jgi:hypothetical protein
VNWDTFVAWEWRPDRRTGYLGDADWDQSWVSTASSHDDEDEDDDHEGQGGIGVQAQHPPRVAGKVSGLREV